MNRKAGAGAIAAGICLLVALFYYLYCVNSPHIQGAYNAKYGPPVYAKGRAPG